MRGCQCQQLQVQEGFVPHRAHTTQTHHGTARVGTVARASKSEDPSRNRLPKGDEVECRQIEGAGTSHSVRTEAAGQSCGPIVVVVRCLPPTCRICSCRADHFCGEGLTHRLDSHIWRFVIGRSTSSDDLDFDFEISHFSHFSTPLRFDWLIIVFQRFQNPISEDVFAVGPSRQRNLCPCNASRQGFVYPRRW